MINVYRGLNAAGDTVVFFEGASQDLVSKAIEKFSGNAIGEPENGTQATLIATINGVFVNHCDDELVEKVVKRLSEPDDGDIDDEIDKLNEEIAKRGLRVVSESAEVRMVPVEKAEEDEGDDDTEEEEERTVLSVVLEPNDGEDGNPLDADTQGDIYSAEVVKNTAFGWMEKGGKVGLMHQLDVSEKVAVLESYIAPVDFDISNGESTYTVRKGSWVLRLRIYDDLLWKKAKDGTLGAFSVGGTAEVQYLEEEESQE